MSFLKESGKILDAAAQEKSSQLKIDEEKRKVLYANFELYLSDVERSIDVCISNYQELSIDLIFKELRERVWPDYYIHSSAMPIFFAGYPFERSSSFFGKKWALAISSRSEYGVVYKYGDKNGQKFSTLQEVLLSLKPKGVRDIFVKKILDEKPEPQIYNEIYTVESSRSHMWGEDQLDHYKSTVFSVTVSPQKLKVFFQGSVNEFETKTDLAAIRQEFFGKVDKKIAKYLRAQSRK